MSPNACFPCVFLPVPGSPRSPARLPLRVLALVVFFIVVIEAAKAAVVAVGTKVFVVAEIVILVDPDYSPLECDCIKNKLFKISGFQLRGLWPNLSFFAMHYQLRATHVLKIMQPKREFKPSICSWKLRFPMAMLYLVRKRIYTYCMTASIKNDKND